MPDPNISLINLSKMKCARCNTSDKDFPFTLLGEDERLIRYKKTKYPQYRNKVVCYNCWELLVYGKGKAEDTKPKTKLETDNQKPKWKANWIIPRREK